MILGERLEAYYGQKIAFNRFITEAMLDRFSRTSWPPPSQASNGRAPQPDIRVDLKAKMRGMWR